MPFVVGRKSVMLKGHSRTSPIELQKVQRLWINRVALIQELNVDHVLPHFIKCGTLTASEQAAILAATSPHKKTCLLIDILPRKGRRVNWYLHLHQALHHPDTFDNRVRKRYKALADFLDNAIIPHVDNANSTMRLPYFKPLTGIISKTNESLKSVDVVESVAAQPTVEHFASLIDEPFAHFERLHLSRCEGDRVLLQQEKLALKKMRKLEMLYAYDKRIGHLINADLSDAVADILAEPKIYHLYFKYLLRLRRSHDIDIMADISQSHVGQLAAADEHPNIEVSVQTSFQLFHFLHDMGDYGACRSVLTTLESILARHSTKVATTLLWQTRLKLLRVYVVSREFAAAVQTFNGIAEAQAAMTLEVEEQIINDACLLRQLIILMQESGDMESALTWCKEAFRATVKCTDPREIVETLCTTSLIYTLTWDASKAELLATEAVRYARHHLGEYDPLYVKALLYYCHYSNQMKQDAFGMNVATMALKTANKIYGGAEIEIVAQLQRGVASALLVGQQTTERTAEAAQMAETAWNTARQVLPSANPTLISFKLTLAQCLQWKAMTGSQNEISENLSMAEQYVKTAHSKLMTTTRAQTLNLLAQIHVKMERLEEAESEMQESCEMQAEDSLHRYLAMATLASYYRTVSRPVEALKLLKEVVQKADSACYLKWLHRSFDTLIALLKATNQPSQVSKYQATLGDWLARNPVPEEATWSLLQSAPTPIADIWQKVDDGSPHTRTPLKLKLDADVVSFEN